jgi:hypothetical protein
LTWTPLVAQVAVAVYGVIVVVLMLVVAVFVAVFVAAGFVVVIGAVVVSVVVVDRDYVGYYSRFGAVYVFLVNCCVLGFHFVSEKVGVIGELLFVICVCH